MPVTRKLFCWRQLASHKYISEKGPGLQTRKFCPPSPSICGVFPRCRLVPSVAISALGAGAAARGLCCRRSEAAGAVSAVWSVPGPPTVQTMPCVSQIWVIPAPSCSARPPKCRAPPPARSPTGQGRSPRAVLPNRDGNGVVEIHIHPSYSDRSTDRLAITHTARRGTKALRVDRRPVPLRRNCVRADGT